MPPVLVDDSETVLVLAGDIDVGKQLVKYVDKLAARFKAVVYILGNHELYGHNIDLLYKYRSTSPNAYFLDNSTVTIDDVEFIGTTLWTDMDGASPLAMMNASANMNDFNYIKQSTNWVRFTSDRWIRLNDMSREFLSRAINGNKRQVVITHHAPDFHMSRDNPYANNSNDVYYYNRGLTDLILESKLWIYGHCHHATDIIIGDDSRILSNPRGYDNGKPSNLVPGFNEEGIVYVS